MSLELSKTERNLLKKVEVWLKDHKEELVQDIEAWVRIPSVSIADGSTEGAPFGKQCAKVLELALRRGEEFGFNTNNHEGYAGSIIYGDYESSIGLIGHLDVVPEGDNWIYSPYEAVRKGDFLIGRGVSDNKGASVAALYIARIFKDLNIPIKHGIHVIYGCAEETGMADLAYYVQHKQIPLVSLVLDGKFPVCHGQKGGLNGRLFIPVGEQLHGLKGGTAENNVPDYAQVLIKNISLSDVLSSLDKVSENISNYVKAEQQPDGILVYAKGRSGHAANPEGSLNAIWILATVLKESGLFKDEDQKAVDFLSSFLADYNGVGAGIEFEDEVSGKLTLNGGIIRSFEKGLELFIDIRYPITTNEEDIKQAIKLRIEPYGVRILDIKNREPYFIEKDDDKVKVLTDTYNSLRGEHAEPYVMGGGTYSRVLPKGITFGPGFPNIKKHGADFLPDGHGGSHGPDEVLHIPSLLEAIKIYVLSIVRLDTLI